MDSKPKEKVQELQKEDLPGRSPSCDANETVIPSTDDNTDEKTSSVDELAIASSSLWDTIVDAVDVLTDLTKQGYSKYPEMAANALLENVIDHLKKVRVAFVETESHSKNLMKEYAEKIVSEKPLCVTTLAPFMAKVYKCLSNGYELKCLTEWSFTVTIWTNASKEMCNTIIREGVLIQLIVQLIDLPAASSDHQEVLADLIHLSMLALLPLIEDREFHYHFRSCRYSDILISNYLPSKNFFIEKMARMCLAFLHRHLNDARAKKHLQLSKQDVTIVFKIIAGKDLTEKEKSEFWHFLSGDGLASMLKCFCRVQTNRDAIIEHNGLHILLECLENSKGDDEEIEKYLLLLWKLSSSCDDNRHLVIEKLQLLLKSREGMKEELQTLAKCVCHAYKNVTPESTDECFVYAENAFKFDLLEECIKFCEKVPKDSVVKDRVALFQGKSLYHIFMQDLDYLSSIPITSPAYSNARLSCYTKVKQAIQYLGIACDTDSIDEEGRKMLDTSMMIFLSESRNLTGKLPRCLLCYKKCKLAKSHICPRAILDDFARTAGAPDSGKAYFVSWPWQRLFTGSLKSSGEMTVRVLCHECESIVSKVESKFLPRFFRAFYNIENPQRITEEQCIDYEEWLYQFCVSLVFRGMVLQYSGEYTEYRNQNEVHALLSQCRKVLLSKVEPGDETPNMSIFIAPTKGDPSEVQASLINVSIHHPFHFFFAHKKYVYGPRQLYQDAFAYVFQIGMIWTTAILPTACWSTDEMFTIHKTGGVYRIPPDCERRSKIPNDLWETILADAMITEKEIMEQPKRAIVFQPLDDLLSVPPVSFMADVLNIQKENTLGKGSMLAGHPKIINYLPSEFSVFHPTVKNSGSGRVTVPESHKVLLHLDSPFKGPADSGKGATAFIAVGDAKHPYGSDSPYLIFHQYEPGLQQNTAFFFSSQSFDFVEYLPDPFLKRFLGDAATSDLIKKCSEIVSLVLKARGYRNYHSLLYWMKAKRGPDSLDMKCSDGCWFCKDLCEICLDQTILGPSTKQGETTLKFCSEQCYKIYDVTPEPHSQIFTPDEQETSTEIKVPEGHKEFLRLYSSGKIDNGCFNSSLSLCEGDGSEFFPLNQHYVNYFIRTPNYQCHYEYFISEDLQPLGVVSYSKLSTINLFDEDDCEDIVKSSIDILQGIFMRSNLSTISHFLEAAKVQKFLLSTPSSLFLSDQPTSPVGAGNITTPMSTNAANILQPAATVNEPPHTMDNPEDIVSNPEDMLTMQQLLEALLCSDNNLMEMITSAEGNLTDPAELVDDESSKTNRD